MKNPFALKVSHSLYSTNCALYSECSSILNTDPEISFCIFVVKSLKGFGWDNVGPASQTVAQYYFTIGPMYRVIRVVVFCG